MRTVKIAVTLDQNLVAQLDQPVLENQFPNRSRAVQEAVRDKLQRLQRGCLARESAKLDHAFEQALADEGLTEDYEEAYDERSPTGSPCHPDSDAGSPH